MDIQQSNLTGRDNASARSAGETAERAGERLTPAARRILRVASALFYERGIHAVSMESIAEAAEVTKKTVYDRFGSKQALVTAYLKGRDDLYRTWLTSGVAERTDDPARRLLVAFDVLDDWMHTQSRRGCAFVNAFAELTDPRHPGRTVAAEQKAWLRDYFTQLAVDAGIPGPEDLADQLLTLHEGAIVAYSVGGYDAAAGAARDAAATLTGAPA